ncbi:hypothetical protein LY78DRAFT_492302 [Colletotrichum sublineola]|nr:hypothetical protein LY78DRAFT_492302 [Colletotrichum sublineola]
MCRLRWWQRVDLVRTRGIGRATMNDWVLLTRGACLDTGSPWRWWVHVPLSTAMSQLSITCFLALSARPRVKGTNWGSGPLLLVALLGQTKQGQPPTLVRLLDATLPRPTWRAALAGHLHLKKPILRFGHVTLVCTYLLLLTLISSHSSSVRSVLCWRSYPILYASHSSSFFMSVANCGHFHTGQYPSVEPRTSGPEHALTHHSSTLTYHCLSTQQLS